MTVKGFFKSNVFKCLITLLCVLLVSGVFLTVMNGLLAVTEQERLDRAINKIYGKSVAYTQVDVGNYYDDATIEAAYKIKDGNYLIKSTGKGGFDNGTVTCWVVVGVKNGTISGIDKVVIDSNKGQSYIDRVGANALNQFTELYEDGIKYKPAMITGATVTATKNAICNAVNGAIEYVNSKWLGNVTTAGEKLLKSIQAVYGDKEISVYGANDKLITVEDETVTSLIDKPVTEGNATVSELYKVKYLDGENTVLHYVVTSTGTGGYKNGTVTCMTVIAVEGGEAKTIYNVTITAETSQSYIDKIQHLDKFKGADVSGEWIQFTATGDLLNTDASYSSRAIVNAVNGAVKYLKTIELENLEGGAD